MASPLAGVRILLSGSAPDGESTEAITSLQDFVFRLAQASFREGATLIHGSHPDFDEPLEKAARAFQSAGGTKDTLILVRSQKYAVSEEQNLQIGRQREYASVQIVPAGLDDTSQSLVPLRTWMAERCDAIVVVGGKHYDVGKDLAGVPKELDEALFRGKPGFALGGFGGAVLGYLNDNPSVYQRLRNGLAEDQNRALAKTSIPSEAVSAIITQLTLLPLVRESMPHGRLFRILSLDGGGLRGVFTAAVLTTWSEMLNAGSGSNLVRNFDMVAGTSTGAILAIGLALGVTPKEMVSFYREKGPKIFPKNRGLRHWLQSKHESNTLRGMLQSVLGDRSLADHSRCRLVIPTVRGNNGEAEAIVTPHSPDRMAFAKISAVDAALASSAAPTYFDEAIVKGPIATESFLDGGLWANNPTLPAIAEAVRHLQIPIDRIDVLSVGTIATEGDFTDHLGQGKAGWASHTVDLFFAAQEHAASTISTSLLSPSRYLRVNQQSSKPIDLDDTASIEEMVTRGAQVGRDSFSTVRSRFLDATYVADWHQDAHWLKSSS